MAYFTKQYAVTTAAVQLTTAMGLADAARAVQIDIKNKAGNAGIVYLGPSTVTNVPANAGAAISADQAWSYIGGDMGRHVSTDEIYIVGSTAAETVFITVVA